MSTPVSLSRLDRRRREAALLKALAARIRHLRDLRGMSRKLFAEQSRVSIPHIARLEGGKGNVSLLILDRLASALGVPLEAMFEEVGDHDAADRELLLQFVRKQPVENLPELRRALLANLKAESLEGRCIALLGLRGAGKSTVGRRLADRLELPFIELDHEIEREAGISLAEIFSKFGQGGYRSLERQVLERRLLLHASAVIATGGGIVTDPPSYELLMRSCCTVWLHAKNEVYLSRTREQNDMRIAAPAIQRTAMDSIRRAMTARRTLYAAADIALDTTELTVEQVVQKIIAARRRLLASETPRARVTD